MHDGTLPPLSTSPFGGGGGVPKSINIFFFSFGGGGGVGRFSKVDKYL